MKNIFKISLFAMGLALSSGTFAATGTGHAQAQLTNPLSIANFLDVNFGTIAIDPGAGAQTLSINTSSVVTCPATYVCSGSTTKGVLQIIGAPNEHVSVSMTGSTATLDDGLGNTLVFDPVFSNATDTYSSVSLNILGEVGVTIGGSIEFDGTEIAGTYTSQNGSGYQVTVNY